ncbi:MAG: serine hydrolase [Pirellulaceae bacterium]|nr:serine hydrolase [Pirellulaceae bacterium]
MSASRRALTTRPALFWLAALPALGLVLLVPRVPTCQAAGLADRLQPLAERHAGQVAISVKHLATGESYGYHQDEPMPTASLIKFPVMATAYQLAADGRLDLNQMLTLRDEDQVPGSGILTTHFSPGTRISLRDAIRLMIAWSDNTATNLVLDAIGIEATSQRMRELGCEQTRIHAKVFRRDTSIDPERSRQFGLGSTTAGEMLRLFELLHGDQLVSPEASRSMREHLQACQDGTKLVRGLPAGARIAHKSGATSTMRCDAGLIDSPAGTLAVCVLTSDNRDRRWDADNAADQLCAEVARVVWQHFNGDALDVGAAGEGAAGEGAAGEPLRLGAMGELVEALQRTLNARLEPSPELAVDGDFGPQTEAAVRRFQQARSLEPTGAVDARTWEALGPLLAEEAPVPRPEVVNGEQLARQPADPLDGPPWVTCKAWAIADARSGKLLWGERQGEPLDQASTTKIMTALLVLRQARERPEVLREEVVFSRRADQTGGSTAGVRAGERLSVEELLYGLLLPSGNDASVALAEHFGSRFEPPDADSAPQEPGSPQAPAAQTPAAGASAQDPLVRFVAEMNREAQRLELKQTRFANPHGLTAAGHHASAADLARLSWHALQVPLFRQYVNTRQRGCTLQGPGGYQRHVVWKNTNQLLGTSGYLGVKTGTTTAAGACLVSLGERAGDELLVVVLGSAAPQARYTDTRNLLRWAWLQRQPRPEP